MIVLENNSGSRMSEPFWGTESEAGSEPFRGNCLGNRMREQFGEQNEEQNEEQNDEQ